MAVAVVSAHFSEVGFWQPGQTPGKADFYLTSTEAADELGDQLQDFRSRLFRTQAGCADRVVGTRTEMRLHG